MTYSTRNKKKIWKLMTMHVQYAGNYKFKYGNKLPRAYNKSGFIIDLTQ